ncbi:MAG: hypothetical protein FJW39_30145 [Acidobacteria bacterium]|nr:hypothetical protein [Acidobacteriota bacterium]
MKPQILLILAASMGAIPSAAQFGGRPGETVVYMLTSKGAQDFQLAPANATNDAATIQRLDVIDVAQVRSIPLGEGFPEGFQRQIMHEEPDDLFQLVTQSAPDTGFHREFLVSYKTFITAGIVRELEFDNFDYTASSLTTLQKGVNFGPDQALITLKVLFWARDSKFPAVHELPLGTQGPAVPPGKTGEEVILGLGKVPFFIPWTPRRRAAAGWPDGIDLKMVEQDPVEGSTIQLLRLRVGAATPPVRITGATHLYVLQGDAEFTAPGKGTFQLKPNHYAFLPRGATWRIGNPRVRELPR